MLRLSDHLTPTVANGTNQTLLVLPQTQTGNADSGKGLCSLQFLHCTALLPSLKGVR